MRSLDHSEADPAGNLALDEALLEAAEAGESGECLRFWESPDPFVVVGLTQRVDDVVYREACAEEGVPILRRCSAGGCVMQGPGCLNFALVLDTAARPELSGIRSSYAWILARVADALKPVADAKPAGISDVAIDGLKFSGNAQRRKRRFILHHGTLLYRFDLERVTRYLREPEDRPGYRGARSHNAFLRNLDMDPSALKVALCERFSVSAPDPAISASIVERMHDLREDKYDRKSWHFRR
jgi:lipoate---protein ligase